MPNENVVELFSENPKKPVEASILIVEDEGVLALSLKNELKWLGYHIVDVAKSGELAIQKTMTSRPDLILMDIALEGEMDGIETANYLHSQFKIPIIYLTAYTSPELLDRAKLTSPFGYLVKPVKTEELQATIEMALYKDKEIKYLEKKETLQENLDAYISNKVEELLEQYEVRTQREHHSLQSLTSRETEIFELIALGYSIKDIATQLSISTRTAETHRSNIMKKLKFSSSNQLLRYAILNTNK
ncbi:response regulator transcription factor [Deltaproteobacteria bacterium TL4]